MDRSLAVEKTVSFRTRDFWAESQDSDGTRFEVTRLSDGEGSKLDVWWDAHRLDNHRHVFQGDPTDECDFHLHCHDEVEAMALVIALQHEWNEVAL